MEILISDTNILIDLCVTGLVEKCSLLDVDFRTVDFVINEITNPAQAAIVQRQIDNGYLTVLQFTQGETLELMDLYARYEYNTNLSLTDCAVMLCAKRGNYRLLTGDKNLRIKATNEGVMVSGILYLTDMMVNERVVAALDMANYLEELLRTNNRLPKDSIQTRIDAYRKLED
jgi:predicted nucleic acid-binding protein